jgi:tRNA U34 5-carboxymethylaminomethyl modifying GTPase MnmE/TrmE
MPNVIVFGETGAGKSAVLNMLDGGGPATVSDAATGVTFCTTLYEKTIKGAAFKVFDTAGLNEAPGGTVSPRQAMDNLYKLMNQVDDGVSLLVYVMRGPRIKESAQMNYKMFFEGFCRKKVPIVIVITGLEVKEEMDEWWEENKNEFDLNKMSFSGSACITAIKGKLKNGKHLYETEYAESKKKVEELIYTKHSPTPWKMSAATWFVAVASTVRDVCTSGFGYEQQALTQALIDALQSHGGLSKENAENAAFSRKLNVLVFGETGVGKSSVINMLEGKEHARVSDSAEGVTLHSESYEKQINGSTFQIFDTVGLNEGPAAILSAKDAIEGLYRLIRQLDNGVNLLLYVVRAPRISAIAQKNYEMFHEAFCHKNVPIVIIITGLEDRENMDGWWKENKASFDQQGMVFSGHACVTAIKGKLRDGKPAFQREYEESKKKIESLIIRRHSKIPWKMPTRSSWLSSTAVKMRNIFSVVLGLEPVVVANELYRALKLYGSLSDKDAKIEAEKVDDLLRRSRAASVS